jgi:8-oxo-dGTP diphosphatase
MLSAIDACCPIWIVAARRQIDGEPRVSPNTGCVQRLLPSPALCAVLVAAGRGAVLVSWDHDVVRGVVRSLVEQIVPWDFEEAEHRLDVLGWIDAGNEIFRTVKPATPPKHLVSYCVLVDTDRGHVLLVDHRDAGRWLPTGGHVEPDEHPAAAASREITEELQVVARFHPAVGARPLLVTVTQTAGRSESHTDVSLWFVFEGSLDKAIVPDETEFVGARWWPFEDVKHGAGAHFEPHLPRFIDKLRVHAV